MRLRVLAPWGTWSQPARLLPGRAARYAAVEREIGHRLQLLWSVVPADVKKFPDDR